jgi:hypothetical protein
VITSLTPNQPEDMPIWARLQLAALGVPFHKVTHWIQRTDSNQIAAAVGGSPVYLNR